MPAGRPRKDNRQHQQECLDIICAAIATTDKGLKRICDARRAEDPNFPHKCTVLDWIRENEEFSNQYTKAKELQADHIFDQILEIADDDSQDDLFVGGDDESGASAKRVQNSEFIARSKLRVDARKWVVARLLPRKYGDRIAQEITGKDGGPVETVSEVVVRPQITREEWLKLHGMGTAAGATTSGD